MTPHVKAPDTTLLLQLDFTAFALRFAEGAVLYTLRAERGISVIADRQAPGVIELTITGGVLGQGYTVGVEATAGGQRQVQLHRIRLLDTREWEALPVVGPIDETGLAVPLGALFLNGGQLFIDNEPLVLA